MTSAFFPKTFYFLPSLKNYYDVTDHFMQKPGRYVRLPPFCDKLAQTELKNLFFVSEQSHSKKYQLLRLTAGVFAKK